jgi:hypothetical protein
LARRREPGIGQEENPVFVKKITRYLSERDLSGFCDLAAFDAVGADVHASRSTLRQLNANVLQVRIEFSRRTIICVRHVVAKLRTFSTDFAAFSHFY